MGKKETALNLPLVYVLMLSVQRTSSSSCTFVPRAELMARPPAASVASTMKCRWRSWKPSTTTDHSRWPVGRKRRQSLWPS